MRCACPLALSHCIHAAAFIYTTAFAPPNLCSWCHSIHAATFKLHSSCTLAIIAHSLQSSCASTFTQQLSPLIYAANLILMQCKSHVYLSIYAAFMQQHFWLCITLQHWRCHIHAAVLEHIHATALCCSSHTASLAIQLSFSSIYTAPLTLSLAAFTLPLSRHCNVYSAASVQQHLPCL